MPRQPRSKVTDKRIINEHIGYDHTWGKKVHRILETFDADHMTIDGVIERMNTIKEQYGDKYDLIRLDKVRIYDYSDAEYDEFRFSGQRFETDEEVAARVEKDQALQAERDARDLAELERLQAKFGKG